MKIHSRSIELFRFAVYAWVIVFLLTSLPAMDALWVRPISPILPPVTPGDHLIQLADRVLPGAIQFAVPFLLFCCVIQLIRPPKWYFAVLIWLLFTGLLGRGWLASSGGQYLIANMLFWLIFLPNNKDDKEPNIITCAAFWIARLQLLLAYAATALHKFTGTHWLDGTAMGIVSSDPNYGPGWLAELPVMAQIATWAVLLFQLSFPIALWWQPTRMPWMIAGMAFHLATAIWLGIPEMALAFIACYTIWLGERDLQRLLNFPGLRRRVAADQVTDVPISR